MSFVKFPDFLKDLTKISEHTFSPKEASLFFDVSLHNLPEDLVSTLIDKFNFLTVQDGQFRLFSFATSIPEGDTLANELLVNFNFNSDVVFFVKISSNSSFLHTEALSLVKLADVAREEIFTEAQTMYLEIAKQQKIVQTYPNDIELSETRYSIPKYVGLNGNIYEITHSGNCQAFEPKDVLDYIFLKFGMAPSIGVGTSILLLPSHTPIEDKNVEITIQEKDGKFVIETSITLYPDKTFELTAHYAKTIEALCKELNTPCPKIKIKN